MEESILSVVIGPDKQEARINKLLGSPKAWTPENIIVELKRQGVKSGIDAEAVQTQEVLDVEAGLAGPDPAGPLRELEAGRAAVEEAEEDKRGQEDDQGDGGRHLA